MIPRWPALSLLAILTLGLGIGANTAIFSIGVITRRGALDAGGALTTAG